MNEKSTPLSKKYPKTFNWASKIAKGLKPKLQGGHFTIGLTEGLNENGEMASLVQISEVAPSNTILGKLFGNQEIRQVLTATVPESPYTVYGFLTANVEDYPELKGLIKNHPLHKSG